MDTDLIDALVEKLKGKLVQTHASWVILTEDFAYKIKKARKFWLFGLLHLRKKKGELH